MSDIYRRRGDTTTIQRTIRNAAGVALNIAGWTIWLTINKEDKPADTTNEIAQMAGAITDAPNGAVQFQPTAEQADFVGRFYYEIRAIDATGVVATLYHGLFVYHQDITKLDESLEYTPPTAPSDGTVAVLDGSVDYLTVSNSYPAFGSSDRDLITYETRSDDLGDRRVFRSMVEPYNSYAFDMYWPYGTAFKRNRFHIDCGWEWRVTAYLKRAAMNLYLFGSDAISYLRPTLDTRTGTPAVTCGCSIVDPATGGATVTTPALPMVPIGGPGGWVDGDWYVMAIRLLADGTATYTAHPELVPDGGGMVHTDVWLDIDATAKFSSLLTLLRSPVPALVRETPENPASFYDFWKYEYRRLT